MKKRSVRSSAYNAVFCCTAAGAILLLLVLVTTGCATTPTPTEQATAPGEVQQPQPEHVNGEAPNITLRGEEGPVGIEIDFSDYLEAGGALRDIHTVRLSVSSRDSRRILLEKEWRDLMWHSGRGNQESPVTVWELPDPPNHDETVLVQLEVGSNHSTENHGWFDSYLTFGPIEWNAAADGAAITLAPHPWKNTGALALQATNETGIGTLNNALGVFMTHTSLPVRYHFHLPPGREYLHYEGQTDRIRAGTYSITVMAWKDEGWPYYGNAVWQGSVAVPAGDSTEAIGRLTENTAPWDLNLTLSDFVLRNEQLSYETSFDAIDARMTGPHTHHQDEQYARLENGNLVVSGPGDLSGGMDISVGTGANRIVRFRALLPEKGEFFINLRRWGDSRMAIIFKPAGMDTGHDSRPLISTFSWLQGRDLAGFSFGTHIPELNSGQWYNYTLLDTGEDVFIFIDNAMILRLPVSDELPDQGDLGLEWHRPCVFDSLSVHTVDAIVVPDRAVRAR